MVGQKFVVLGDVIVQYQAQKAQKTEQQIYWVEIYALSLILSSMLDDLNDLRLYLMVDILDECDFNQQELLKII